MSGLVGDCPRAASPANVPSAGPFDCGSGGRAGLRRDDHPWPVDDRASWRVAAWVASDDLSRLAAALGPEAVLVPCTSLDALSAAVGGGAEAAVVRAACVGEEDVADFASLVSGHAATVFAGLHGFSAGEPMPDSECIPASVFNLWAAGVAAVVCPIDGVDDSAWPILRRSLAAARLQDPVQRACVAAVLDGVWGEYRTDLDERERGAPGEAALLAFFAAAFGPAADAADAGGDVVGAVLGDVAARLGGDAAALEARFAQRGLPDAADYVAAARLVRAAWLGTPPAPSAVAAAWRVVDRGEPAGIQRNARRLRRLAALGAGASGGRAAGKPVLRAYCEALVTPYRDVLSTLDPACGAAP